MNSMSVSTGISLVGTVLSLEFLSQCVASSVSSLSSVNTPLTKVSPTIEELDDLDADNPTKLTDLSDSKIASYTQKQLECAERLGVSPLACNVEGQFIRQKKNSDDGYFVQKIKRQENTESEDSGDDSSDGLSPGVIAGIFFAALIMIACGAVDILLILLVFCRDEKQPSVEDSGVELKKIMPTFEALIKKIELGRLDVCFAVGIKDSETGLTVLHELGFKQPQRIEKWVDEGKLEVERDLGNKKEEHLDDFGNSVLHVIALHYPNIIDKWVRSDKISIDELDRIKNYKDQSVLFYIKEMSPEIYSAFQNISETVVDSEKVVDSETVVDSENEHEVRIFRV